MIPWRGIIEEYRKFLPVSEHTPIISLCEGNTPLIRADRLAEDLPTGRVVFEGGRGESDRIF